MSSRKSISRRSFGPLLHNSSGIEADVSSGGIGLGINGVDEALAEDINDDNAERRVRRHHRVLELQQKKVLTPSIDNAGRNRLSLVPTGVPNSLANLELSTSELAKHYSNCIKLSSENKITMKNAFGLHLIDCLAEILKTEDSEMNNFRAYGCTLDASAKIYGYRVDCVHAETQKIISGLGRSSIAANDNNKRNFDESVDELTEDNDVQKKKQRRTVNKRNRNATIEKNLKNINATKSMDHHSEVFRRTTELFTDGCSGGVVLLNTIGCRNDSGELVLDSMDALNSQETETETGTAETPSEFNDPIDITQFQIFFNQIASGKHHICPEFAEFEFNNWNPEDGIETNWKLNNNTQCMEIFINNASEPLECDLDDDNVFDQPMGVDDGAVPADDDYEDPLGGHPKPPNVTINIIEDPNMEKLGVEALMNLTMQGLAIDSNEYSYFKKDFASAWAGPNHLRMRMHSKGLFTTKAKGDPKPRTKKTAFHIEYSQDLLEDIKRTFKGSNGNTRLSSDTRKKWTRENLTLVVDMHYDKATLPQLFLNKFITIRQKKPVTHSADADLNNYDYDNPNDVENFCPATEAIDHGGRLSTTSVTSDTQFSPTSHGFPESNVGDFDMHLGGSQDAESIVQNTITTFAGDNLVQQPRKVNTHLFPFLRAAKRVNIRHLKQSIWSILKASNGTPDNPSEDRAPTPDEVKLEHSFCKIYRQLSSKLSPENAANLTLPMAFVCALHIANEKSLELIPQEDMKDFKIHLPFVSNKDLHSERNDM